MVCLFASTKIEANPCSNGHVIWEDRRVACQRLAIEEKRPAAC